MGIVESYHQMRVRMSVSKTARKAAGEMWQALAGGCPPFEVPISLNAADDTMQAVWLLFTLHPELPVVIRQSKSFIIHLPRNGNVELTDDVRAAMRKGGQLGDVDTFRGSIQQMLSGQENFLVSQGLDPREMEREAKEREAAKHQLTVVTEKTEPAEAEATEAASTPSTDSKGVA